MTNEKHPLRRSVRLPHRDYSFPGTYFVTICTDERHALFGRIQQARLIPSQLGRLVRECWVAIPLHFAQVELHEFVVMPNHLHGLIAILRKTSAPLVTAAAVRALVGAQHCCALPPGGLGQAAVTPGSIGAIVRSFKSIVTQRAHDELGWKGPIWQRNYFERVLRDGKEFDHASRYIAENPQKLEWTVKTLNAECAKVEDGKEGGRSTAAPLQLMHVRGSAIIQELIRNTERGRSDRKSDTTEGVDWE